MDRGSVTAAPQDSGDMNSGEGSCHFMPAERADGGLLFQIRRQIRMGYGVFGHGRTVALTEL